MVLDPAAALQLHYQHFHFLTSCGREKETFRVNSTNSINIAIIGLISQKSPIYLHYLNQHRIGSNVYVKITPGDISAMYAVCTCALNEEELV